MSASPRALRAVEYWVEEHRTNACPDNFWIPNHLERLAYADGYDECRKEMDQLMCELVTMKDLLQDNPMTLPVFINWVRRQVDKWKPTEK